MSTPSLNVMIPPPVAEPRGARWAAQAAHRVGAAVWGALHAVGRSRARRELLALARARAVGDPALAHELRLAAEAAEVREMAGRVQKSDPGHAADLIAAADRHERLAPAGRPRGATVAVGTRAASA